MSIAVSTGTRLYLDLMKKCLTRTLFPDSCVNTALETTGWFDPDARREGKDWPSEADTMIGLLRLENIERCAIAALEEGIPGDFVEAGVWRGGASIFLRAILKAFANHNRRIWVIDSFAGLPASNPDLYPADAGDKLSEYNAYLGVPLERVKANFAKYGLLDEQVRFLPGWFKDSLPSAPIQQISVLRLDGDMYESTMDILNSLYGRVSQGGYVIVDDYGALANCRAAVDDFRAKHTITEEIVAIDWTGVYWQRR
jgi:hypothetical protein